MGFLQRFLQSPQRVFITCLLVATGGMLINGSFLTLWSMHRDRQLLTDQIRKTQQQIASLDQQLHQAKDPSFIEKQALDRFDLVGENDLVFMFSED